MRTASINSNNRTAGHMFSNPAELLDIDPFSPASDMHSMPFPQESDAISWGTDLFDDMLPFPDNVPIQNDHVGYSGSDVLGGNAKPTEFKEWVDQLMSVDDDSLNPNWNELLGGDNNMAEPITKVCTFDLILICTTRFQSACFYLLSLLEYVVASPAAIWLRIIVIYYERTSF